MTAALDLKRQQVAAVPCGRCNECCKSDRIVLHPKLDRHEDYQYHLEPQDGGWVRVLDRKSDGACIYLAQGGCSIHGRAPTICQRFDCRTLVQMTPSEIQARRVQQNPQMAKVYAAGIERLALA